VSPRACPPLRVFVGRQRAAREEDASERSRRRDRVRAVSTDSKKSGSKNFIWLKEKAQILYPAGIDTVKAAKSSDKSFLVLFFKKEHLP
jgi:hypothetical protein